MKVRSIFSLAVLVGCAEPAAPPATQPSPPVRLEVEAPWVVVRQEEDSIVLRLGDGAHGARVQLLRDERGRIPGVSPIHAGQTLEVDEEGSRWPLIAVAHPERPLSRVEIVVDGVDLLVRYYGPPLSEVANRADAPPDKVITWVRLRSRPDDWRIVLDGLGTVSLPADNLRVSPGQPTGWQLDGDPGGLSFTSDAVRWRTTRTTSRWTFSTLPALEATQPYPRTAMTWTPR
ncbi:MAG: hypothetical protein JRJ84_12545 [Deltaproteobacteria bacterium]|nr:hypothetical protein [Deltaproteobacteria bacterium]